MKHLHFFILIILFQACFSQEKSTNTTEKINQDSIIFKLLKPAFKLSIYSQDYQKALDKAIEVEPNLAFFWQQKAMPLVKMGKHELAMPFLDKAVELDEGEYLDYRAFIKCIFARSYSEAIKEFKHCKTKFGNGYVMDHSYDFYIALCKLQLNQFKEAEKILRSQIEKDMAERGKDWVHFTEYFYLGICLFEQGKYQDAIKWFDLAINSYTEFPEANYYKALCLKNLDKIDEGKAQFKLFEKYKEQGFTINESNSQYIRYPYQLNW